MRSQNKHHFPPTNRTLQFTLFCVFGIVAAYGQMTAPNKGTLLGSQSGSNSGTLLSPHSTPNNPGPRSGVLLSPQSHAALPHAVSCSVDALQLQITTGNDDLRGGKDNLNVEIHFANGDMQSVSNINNGIYWKPQSINAPIIHLKQRVALNQIKQIRLIHVAQGGYAPPSTQQVGSAALPVAGPLITSIAAAGGVHTEDNWDMAQMQVFALAKGVTVPIASSGFHRFTGSNPSFDINTQPGATCATGDRVTKVSFTFVTADDDLRGGNDNLNITILFTDGTSQAAGNVNRSENWPNGSTKGAEVLLSRSVTIDQIRGFTLEDTFIGGPGGDNWNMASMQADAFLADGTYHTIAKSGFHRFSSDWSGVKAKQIRISAHKIN